MFSFSVNVLVFIFFAKFASVPEILAYKKKDIRKDIPRNSFEMNLGLIGWIEKPRKNLVAAPILMRMSLCKLATAAHGPAKHELMNVLDYSRQKTLHCEAELRNILQVLKDSEILFLNKMYVNYSGDINPKFIDRSTQEFGIHVDKVPFNKPRAVVKYINDWFDKKGLKTVSDILTDKDVGTLTSILLVSAAHIQSSWEMAFNILLSEPKKFKGMNHKISDVIMMRKTDAFLFYDDIVHNFKIIQTNLMADGLSMTFVLPERTEGLPDLLKNFALAPQVLQAARNNMKYTPVAFSIPRFQIRSAWDFEETIWKMGVQQVFNWNASGLEAILRSHHDCKTIYLSKAKQKVLLEVDEFGVYRSPIRAREYFDRNPLKGKAPGLLEFLADHPFLFTLNLQVTPGGPVTELAVGVYYGPD